MVKNQLIRIIKLIGENARLSEQDYEQLRQALLETQERLQILDSKYFHSVDIDTAIYQRSRIFQSTYAEISQILDSQNIQIDPPSEIFLILWHYWIPLAQHLVNRQQQVGRTFIQGLLGGQGTGKTTLGIVLNILLRHLGKTFLSISIDDIYKTHSDRQKLRDRRPDFIWRGPPSTHDVHLGIQVLQQLRDRHRDQAIAIPRFDKSLHHGAGDRTAPEISYGADIVLFEGWFVGMHPLPISAFRNFVPPILSESDRDFALECNANLYNYLPLWEYLDSLIVLKPQDYTHSLQWRIEAEHKLINSGKKGMDDLEITRFVEYFWKALHPELFMPNMTEASLSSDRPPVDLVIEISRSHLPTRIYSPKSV